MDHGHLRQAEHHRHGDEAGDRVAQQHGRPGVAQRYAAGEEQAGADRPAQADHHRLALGQAPVQAGFPLADGRLGH
ncbi:MAG: hypothetical protein WDM85_01775 [Caulobacteraceae bacterium]